MTEPAARHILLCTLGGSWAVIPEVFGFLDPVRLPLYREHPDRAGLDRLRKAAGLLPPEEIWVGTTRGEATTRSLEALWRWAALLPGGPALRVWQAEDTDELASQAECDRFRELLLRICLLAQDKAGSGQVVLSLAGGRKTMSADLQWAGSVLGCQALIHVVGLRLPEALNKPTPELMSAALPPELACCLAPLVTGEGRRSELLDVDLDGAGPVAAPRFPVPLAVRLRWSRSCAGASGPAASCWAIIWRRWAGASGMKTGVRCTACRPG
jgi:adenosine deaminase